MATRKLAAERREIVKSFERKAVEFREESVRQNTIGRQWHFDQLAQQYEGLAEAIKAGEF